MDNEVPAFIRRAYRVRLRLTREQQHKLNRLFGAARYVWNWALETRTEAYRERGEQLDWVKLSSLFTQYRRSPGTEWLASFPRSPFTCLLRDQQQAFKNFFAKRTRYPRFRRRGAHDSVRFQLDWFRHPEWVSRKDGQPAIVSLPKLGRVRFKNTYGNMPGRLLSVTLSRNAAGEYYASFAADQVPAPALTKRTRKCVGVDLGLADLATLSTGETVPAPRALAKHLLKLKRYQRAMRRQRDAAMRSVGLDPRKPIPKGTRLPVSNRMRRRRQRIGRLHVRITNIRQDALQKATTGLVRRFGVICLEDLNVKGMARSMGRHAFRRSVADAALGEFRRQITYKAAWHGRVLSFIDRFYPSSKACFRCGTVNSSLTLNERRWRCTECGARHNRDLNAAKNIRREGLRRLSSTPRSVGNLRAGRDPGTGGGSRLFNQAGLVEPRMWQKAPFGTEPVCEPSGTPTHDGMT